MAVTFKVQCQRTAFSDPLGASHIEILPIAWHVDDTLARLSKRGAELVGKVAQYEDKYRRCYIRGPERILIGVSQGLGQAWRLLIA